MKLTVQFALLLGILVVLSGTGGAVAIVQLKKADDAKTAAFDRASGIIADAEAVGSRAREELSLALGYMRGTATRADIEAERAEFERMMAEAERRAVANDEHGQEFLGHLENISTTEASIFVVSTMTGPRPLWDVVEAQRRAASEALQGMARDGVELDRLAAAETEPEVAAAVGALRLVHADVRVAFLEYAPSLEEASKAQERQNTFLALSADVSAELDELAARRGDPSLAALAASIDDTSAAGAAYFESASALQRHAGELLGARLIHLDLLSSATMDLAQQEALEHRDEAQRQQKLVRVVMTVTILATLAPVGVAGVFLVSRVRGRLREFDSASLAVSQGKFDAVPPTRHDDFDNLATGWANMVDALQRREREVAEKNDVLVQNERMAALGSLLAGVAHEVNNPLAFIKSNEEMSIQDIDDVLADPAVSLTEEARANLGAVRSSLTTNIDGIARVEKINHALKGFSAQKRDARELVDVNDVAEGVLIIAHNRLKNRFRIARVFEPVPKVRASPQELGQVILNLVINASEASPAGSTIVVRTQVDGGFVKLSVSDDGPGVSPEIRARLFDRYATTKATGTGLGLHISRTIAESHGGALDLADSSKGATFVMSLPIVQETPRIVPLASR